MQSKDVLIEPIFVCKVRDKFLADCRLHCDLYDECDVNNVCESDWTIKRFLIACNSDVEKAFLMLRDAMRWRKSYGINCRTDLDYPKEFYKSGAFFPCCKDKNGNVLIYMRIKLYKKFPKYTDYIKEFFLHIINKVDSQVGESGWSMIWDCTGIGPSNWDISMLRFVISSIKNYFPKGMSYAIMFGIPRIMSVFVSIGLRLLPEDARHKIIFATYDELLRYVDEENIPDFMGGKCKVSYREIPVGARDGKDIGVERGYSLEEIESVRKFYEKYIED